MTMHPKIAAEEKNKRRHFKQLFRACKNPYVDAAELKLQLEKSSWGVSIHDHPFMAQETKEEQKKDINKYLSYDDAVDRLSNMLGWSDNETESFRSRENDTLLRLFYRCESTTVLTSELIHNMTHCSVGAHAPGHEMNPTPEREQLPEIYNTRLFVKTDPGYVAWPQLRKYIHDFYVFCDFVMRTDELFFKLQIEKSNEYLGEHHRYEDLQDYHQPVKFVTFLTEFGESICSPLNCLDEVNGMFPIDEANSHEFWSTKTGETWFRRFQKDQKAETDTVDLISWKDVYHGLLGMMKTLPTSLDEIAMNYQEHWKPAQNPSVISSIVPKMALLTGAALVKITDEDQTIPAPAQEPAPRTSFLRSFFGKKAEKSTATLDGPAPSEQVDIKQSETPTNTTHPQSHEPIFGKGYKTHKDRLKKRQQASTVSN